VSGIKRKRNLKKSHMNKSKYRIWFIFDSRRNQIQGALQYVVDTGVNGMKRNKILKKITYEKIQIPYLVDIRFEEELDRRSALVCSRNGCEWYRKKKKSQKNHP